MTERRAVLAGASGFIGRRLVEELTADGYQVAQVGRTGPDARWGEPERLAALVDGADLLINLAGRSVGCRYTDAHRDEIYRSRIDTTTELHRAVAAAADPPSVWLNASTGTIYRYALDRPQTEADGELGSGFSVDVARDWERAFFAGDLPGTRRVALRMAIVLGDGPALQMLSRAARLRRGRPPVRRLVVPAPALPRHRSDPDRAGHHRHRSHGEQRFSWIHLDDLVEAVRFVIARPELRVRSTWPRPAPAPTGC